MKIRLDDVEVALHPLNRRLSCRSLGHDQVLLGLLED
jgi:hypothetical protein